LPILFEPGAVLAAVKDAARRCAVAPVKRRGHPWPRLRAAPRS